MTVLPKSMAGGVDGVVNGRHAQGGVAEDYNGKQGRAQIQSREILINILLDLLSISKLLVVPFKLRLFLGKDKEDQHVQTLKHITSISFASHSKKCEQ